MKLFPKVLFFMFISNLMLAGDSSTFISVGWSLDYNYYAFAQYGEEDGSGFPYAELYVVDVAGNAFVNGGMWKESWTDLESSSVRGIHVYSALLLQADSLLQKFGIHPDIQVDQIKPKNNNFEIKWLSQSKKEFSLQLLQKTNDKNLLSSASAAFNLKLSTREKTKTIGNIKRFRKSVLNYEIDHVLASPQGHSLIVVVRMIQTGYEGPSIRYMVETLKTIF